MFRTRLSTNAYENREAPSGMTRPNRWTPRHNPPPPPGPDAADSPARDHPGVTKRTSTQSLSTGTERAFRGPSPFLWGRHPACTKSR